MVAQYLRTGGGKEEGMEVRESAQRMKVYVAQVGDNTNAVHILPSTISIPVVPCACVGIFSQAHPSVEAFHSRQCRLQAGGLQENN